MHLKYGGKNEKKNHRQYEIRPRCSKRQKYTNQKIFIEEYNQMLFCLNRDFLQWNCLEPDFYRLAIYSHK